MIAAGSVRMIGCKGIHKDDICGIRKVQIAGLRYDAQAQE
jgi:hypothetical protein